MNKELFYKAISILSTLGLFFVGGSIYKLSLNINNDIDNELDKTKSELKALRKETLNEVKALKKELITEIESIKEKTLYELKVSKTDAINKLKKIGNKNQLGVSMLIRYTGGGGTSMVTVPMQSFDQCELAGATMEASKRFTSTDRNIGFECVETGKWKYFYYQY